MSIELEWEVTDAPRDSAQAAAPEPGSDQPPGALPLPPAPPRPSPRAPSSTISPPSAPRPSRRWVWPVVTLLVLAGLGGSATWAITRMGWQRVSDDVIALVRYEEDMSRQGQTNLVMNVQDAGNVDWLVARRTQLDEALPAPLPVPVVEQTAAQPDIGAVQPLDTNFVAVEVGRAYRAADGALATFVLPQIYVRDEQGEWQHTAPPGDFWGAWQDWRSDVLHIRHSARDETLVAAIAPRLEGWLRAACQGWNAACQPGKLYLSGFVGSLEYDPLANVEVRVEFGIAADALPPDYFLSVPSPQISGIPDNAAAQDLLAEYLAVRLIAALAEDVAGSTTEAMTLAAQAITALGLDRADPGFVALAHQMAEAAAARTSTTPDGPTGERSPAGDSDQRVAAYSHSALWREYLIQPGDTLLGIANQFSVTVEDLLLWNQLNDRDFIVAGNTLLIAVSSLDELPPP